MLAMDKYAQTRTHSPALAGTRLGLATALVKVATCTPDRDVALAVVAAFAAMTALAQELLEAAPEQIRNKFWENVLPDGPL